MMTLKVGDQLRTPHPKRVIAIEIVDVSLTGYGYKYVGDEYQQENNYLRSEVGTDPFFTSGFWTVIEDKAA